MTKRKRTTRRKTRRTGLCKNIGSSQLEVNIIKQRIQQIKNKNKKLIKKK